MISILRLLHLFGFALLGIGLYTQRSSELKLLNREMFVAEIIQLLTGLSLTILKIDEINHSKVGVKFLILIIIMLLSFVNKSKYSELQYKFIVFLYLLQLIIASLWV